MFANNDLGKIGQIENGVHISTSQSLNRDEVTLALKEKLQKMKVDQSFLIKCADKHELVRFRAKAHQASKDADVKIITRERKKHIHLENGLRVWKVRKPHKKQFSISDSGQ